MVPNITNGVPIDDYIAIASFLYFGIKSIYDGLSADGTDSGIAEERWSARGLESGCVVGIGVTGLGCGLISALAAERKQRRR